MMSQIKTSILLLFLLCVTKPIQPKNVESIDKLTGSNDTEAVERKANISDNSTLKRLDKLENTTDDIGKTTEISEAKGEEEKKRSDLQDEIETVEEKKGNHTLRRKRRSHISGIKRKYNPDGFDSNENSEASMYYDSSITHSYDSEPDSAGFDSYETHDSSEDNAASSKVKEDFFYFLKSFLDNSCVYVESYSALYNSIQYVLDLMEYSEIDVQIDSSAIMSYLSNFEEIWEGYCVGPRQTNNALDFLHEFVSKISRIYKSTTSDRSQEEFDSQQYRNSVTTTMGTLLNANNAATKRSIFSSILKIISKILGFITHLGGGGGGGDGDNTKRQSDILFDLMYLVKGLGGGKSSDSTKRQSDVLSDLMNLVGSFAGGESMDSTKRKNQVLSDLMNLVGSLAGGESMDSTKRKNQVWSILRSLVGSLGGSKRSNNDVDELTTLVDTMDTSETDIGDQGEQSEGESNSEETGLARKSEDEEPTLEKLLERYCILSQGSSSIIKTLKALLKEFEVNDETDISRRKNINAAKFLMSLKKIIDKDSDHTKRSGYEAAFVKGAMEKYCQGLKRSTSALTSFSKVLVPQEGDNSRRSTLFSSRALLDDYIDGSKRSVDILEYLNSFLAKYCELPDPDTKRLDSANKNIDFQRTHMRETVRPKVRTKSNQIDFISRGRRGKRSEHGDMIGWRHGVFEPNKSENVSKRQTEKSSPRIIKKSKIRRLKKPQNLKSRLINLYNGKENDTRTKGHRGPFSKGKIIGHKENPSTSFEVKAGVEKDMGSKDSNPRLRCIVRTKGSMSDADGRTGSSKGHTFSEVPSNDTKALLCSSETSEVHRPSKDVYIKQSVSGKSIVSYDNPDKYIRHNYSPSKENLEIGTSGFSTLNDTSSKNQSISVVSTDSQNADSISRSETKFVQGRGSQKGMESSANVEGSIDAVPNKNPFITNSRQHSLGMIVENPDKNMESPLPVEKNEKLQTYSKFQRTEDFDINFRRFDPERSRPEFDYRRRHRRLEFPTIYSIKRN